MNTDPPEYDTNLNNTIFVGNLGFNVLEEELKQNLQLFREIISAKIHESKGVVLFNLTNRASCQNP
ncbi:hypothetical protein MTR_7g053230 [Medicago truncatula]|uniref:Nucleotide-binding alpha-beta plait domain-containing protein n=1 Tax=Medicago truncatula TaxID=3880 RepID=A0A072TZC2_MEDTR|nr:hypothetical protein MTR_7g053230 [Medicago truncatula]